MLFLVSIIAGLFFGCSHSTEPQSTYDLVGNVILYDDSGQLQNYSGITVTVGSSHQSASTDTAGNWSIKGIAEQTQTLTFSGSAITTFEETLSWPAPATLQNNVRTISNIRLFTFPTFYIKSLSATMASAAVQISGAFSVTRPPGKTWYVMLFFGTDSTVSSDPQKYAYATYLTSVPDSAFSGQVSTSSLYQAGIPTSSTVYVAAYGTYNLGIDTKYEDPNTQRYYYCCLSQTVSPRASIKLP